MNFTDLYKKISQIDEGLSQGNMMPQAVSAPPSAPLGECGGMGECGEMGPEVPAKQQDSVSMSVNMNASGVGGIRDLMNVLQNLEQSIDVNKDVITSKPSDEPIDIDISAAEELVPPTMPTPEEPPALSAPAPTSDQPITDEYEDNTDYANDPEIRKMSVAAVMGTGDDLASKGKEAPKQAGGGNPWNVSESKIAAKLSKHYAEVKTRTTEARETDFDINNPRAAGKMQGSWDREFKDFKRQEHEAEWKREQEIRRAEREAKQNAEDGPWYINSGGKILKTGGQPKVFDSLRGAKGYVKAIRKTRPDYAAILTRNPQDTDPLDFMKRDLRLNYNFSTEPGNVASGYRPGIYNHFYGEEGTKSLQKAYEYFVALSKDPNTDPDIQQKSAADAEAMAKELEYRKQNGTIG